MDIDQDVIPTERCADAFSRIFWAIFFLLDIRLGIGNVHIDILPDVIGWIMIASAFKTILDLSPFPMGKSRGSRNPPRFAKTAFALW